MTEKLSLQLSKFSYATVSRDTTSPIPWTHLSGRDNMFAIFDTSRTQMSNGQIGEVRSFKVLRGPEIMEQMDLEMLANKAQEAVYRGKVLNMASNIDAVTIIVQLPCIAIRYPTQAQQIRRFQMRFAKDADYCEALRRLAEVNAPFTEASAIRQQLRPRPTSSSSSHLTRSDSVAQVASPSAPASSMSGSGIASVGPSSLVGQYSLSRATPITSSVYSVRPVTSIGTLSSTSESQLYMPPAHQVLHTLRPAGSPHSIPSSISNATERAPVPPRPSSLQTTDRGIDLSSRSRFFLPASDSSSQNLCITQPLPSTNESQNVINMYEPRPSTAPALESQHLSQMLPPRRDLPFLKPVSRNWRRSAASENNFVTISPADAATTPEDFVATTNCANSSSTSQILRPREELAHEKKVERMPGTQKTLDPKPSSFKQVSTRAASSRKTAATRSRKKATAKVDDTPVPSVEELLRRAQQSAEDVAVLLRPVDPQPLVPRVEKQQEAVSASISGEQYALLPQVEHGASSASEQMLQEGICFASSAHQADPRPENMNLDSPIKSHGLIPAVSKSSDSLEQPQYQEQVHITDISATSELHKSPLASIAGQCLPNHSSAAPNPISPLASLLQDPNFGPSLMEPSWESLPPKERHAAFENFVCAQLQDEGFCRLVVEVEGAWRRVFFGG